MNLEIKEASSVLVMGNPFSGKEKLINKYLSKCIDNKNMIVIINTDKKPEEFLNFFQKNYLMLILKKV